MSSTQTPPEADLNPPSDQPPPGATETLAAESGLMASSLGEYAGAWWKRAKSGESGMLPVILGLVVIVVIFQLKNSVFLSGGNLTNLFIQGSAFVLFGAAEVFVLLLGEIDLSVGYVGAVSAVFTVALTSTPHHWPWWLGVIVGLAVGTAIGTVWGLLITILRLPSFVVTLAGLLGLQGVLIYLCGSFGGASGGGTITIDNQVILNLVNGNLSPALGWSLMIVVVLAYAVLAILSDRNRRAGGLVTAPFALTVVKIAVVAVAGVVIVLICNVNRGRAGSDLRGVPWVIPIVLLILLLWSFVLNRTRFGRYIYAIGGNAEAARRAGISLVRIRTTAFALTGLTAAAGGIVYASRLGSISADVDGGQLVLYAVAAAVIGGTSLFGGRGKVLHALLGGIVIAAIYNGMGLIGLAADLQLIVTALVLLAAVIVDAVARRGRTTG